MSRILAIEDSGAIRLLLTRRLERSGHEVETLADLSVAVRLLEDRDRPEHPDVILLDLGLPGHDGTGAVAGIGCSSPGTPVILISARHDLEQIETPVPVAGRMSKPIDFDRLLRLIDRLTAS